MKRPSAVQVMKQASVASWYSISACLQATSSASALSSSSSSPSTCTMRFVYITILQSFYYYAVGTQLNPPRTLISVADYEEGFCRAVRTVYGPNGIEDLPTGVTALFEAHGMKNMKERRMNGKLLLCSFSCRLKNKRARSTIDRARQREWASVLYPCFFSRAINCINFA